MKHISHRLLCGLVLGVIYYLAEVIWNLSFDRLNVDVVPLMTALLIYAAGFGLLGLIGTTGLELVFGLKEKIDNFRAIQCAWITTAIANAFFGGSYLIFKVFFFSSGINKIIIITVLSCLTAVSCYLLYYLINKFFIKKADYFKTVHYSTLLSANIFMLMAIKVNLELRTPPWSSGNLFRDFIILLVSSAIGGVCFLILRSFAKGMPKLRLSLIIIIMVSAGIVIYSLYGKVTNNKSIGRQADKILSKNVSPVTPVILITLDTLRADHLGVYGYGRETSPNIDRFAKDGVLWENAIVQVPLTRPSHFSILSGRYPSSHGLLDNFSATPENVPLLSNILGVNGYETAAFVSAAVLNSSFNTKLGFQVYSDRIENVVFDNSFLLVFSLRKIEVISRIKAENSASETNKKVFTWLKENEKGPFFMWVHYFDPHTPYSPDPSFRKMFTDSDYDIQKYYSYEWEKENYDSVQKKVHIDEKITHYAVALYDAEIRTLDNELGSLFNQLKELKLYERSLIILTADHGESFDHGYYFDHGDRLYEGLIRVPLIIKFPKEKWQGKTIETQVKSIDIAPTIIEYLSLKHSEKMDGKSMISQASNNDNNLPVETSYAYSQTPYQGFFYYKAKELQSIRSNKWKYIYDVRTGAPELYDINSDPGEQNNFASSRPDILKEFNSELLNFTNSINKDNGRSKTIEIDSTTKDQLKSLGYIK